MKEKTNEKIALKVSRNTIIVNLFLAVFKFLAGLFGNSAAMISDAIHTASDGISTIFVMIGVKISNKEADEKHPYGHERFECVASIVLASFLLATALGIGYSGIRIILTNDYNFDLSIPGVITIIAALISILVKEWMYWYTIKAANKINSGALKADAWHSRSDSLSTIIGLVGIILARAGFPIFDPLMSIVICLFIIKVSIDIYKDAFSKMLDTSCDEKTIELFKEIILKQEGVIQIDKIKTRKFAEKIYIDLEISVSSTLNVKEAHEIAHKIHDSIEKNFPKVKHCMIHVNPKE